MTTKDLSGRHVRWELIRSQYNFKIEYRPGREGGKPDALTRREADLPTEGDERLTQNLRILLPKEKYWEEINTTELVEFQDKDEERIPQASKIDEEIQAIKTALEQGQKEMKGVALGLCQWKDDRLWYQGKIWIPNEEDLRTAFIHQCHDDPTAGHGGTAKTTDMVSRRYYWPKTRENNQTIRQELRYLPTDEGGTTCTIRITTAKRSTRSSLEVYCDGLHHRFTSFGRK